jgi:hypothetical protein
MLRAMNTHTRRTQWVPALALALLGAAPAALAAVTMQGEVALDYYVAEVDADGYEWTDASFYVERIANDGAARSGPLSLSGWATGDANPDGSGAEVGYCRSARCRATRACSTSRARRLPTTSRPASTTRTCCSRTTTIPAPGKTRAAWRRACSGAAGSRPSGR